MGNEAEVRELQRESSLGFHMLNTFQSCPRKWYIKYVCGVLPSKVGKALLFGRAWHCGMEAFYKGSSADDAYEVIIKELNDSKLSFRNLDDYNEMLEKAPILFRAWFEKLGQKLHEEYQVLEVELELKPKIAEAFTMTIRPDAVVKQKSTGSILIPEHKTTSYSAQAMIETVEAADQATAYTWGLAEAKPEYRLNLGGVLLDVVYSRGVKTDVQQITLIRSKFSLAEFELSMLGLFVEIAQRLKAIEVKPGMEAYYFPRNGSACSNFGCEYSEICRTKVTPGMVLGANYFVDPWSGRETLLSQHEEFNARTGRPETA